jgi:hypothetical protein
MSKNSNENIELKIYSKSPHTSQIITGFLLLEEKGMIDTIQYNTIQYNTIPHQHIVECVYKNKRICFDVADGYNLDREKLEQYLCEIDYYFKRSFSAVENEKFTNGHKIYPLGFNFYVTHKNNPLDKRNKIKLFIKEILKKGEVSRKYVTQAFEDKPKYRENLKILFMTRLWQPNTGNKFLDEERIRINKMRIKIIRELREVFPNNFIGGIYDNKFSKEIAKDCILSQKWTNKHNYLNLVKDCDICIGSKGLHKSIGWKTGEYVAAAKAIVCESFDYEVTGNFDIGKNYYSFDDANQCIEYVNYLMNNPQKVYKMKKNNEIYYNEYLRPDKLISNALDIVLLSI